MPTLTQKKRKATLFLTSVNFSKFFLWSRTLFQVIRLVTWAFDPWLFTFLLPTGSAGEKKVYWGLSLVDCLSSWYTFFCAQWGYFTQSFYCQPDLVDTFLCAQQGCFAQSFYYQQGCFTQPDLVQCLIAITLRMQFVFFSLTILGP